MTLPETIEELQLIGNVRAENGKLKLRFPETQRSRLEPAIQVLRLNRDAALMALAAESSGAVPPPESWPESLLELARERGQQTGDPEAARSEIWLSWCEWKAWALNRLFQEQAVTVQPSRITVETIRTGIEKALRRREASRS